MWNIFRSSFVGKRARNISGDSWLNVSSFPQRLRDIVVSNKELRIDHDLGKMVVLLFFWDYGDPASLQDVPHIRALWEQYEGPNFLVIGIHTPQLELAADSDKVQAAVLRFDLDFPMANDASYATWKRYDNTVWPRKILIDTKGIIQYDHNGEGDIEALEKKIRSLLEPARDSKLFPAVEESGNTPDIAFGSESARMQGIAASPPTEPAQYHLQFKLPLHHYGLSGWWIIQEHQLVSGKLTDDQACVVHFLGTGAVVGGRSEEGCSLEVLINSKPLPEHMRGRDIVMQGGRT
ncbi:MAG TPA: thioredoxin-like domain-containing protein, partial [Candidatus Andersenbacteria bacterium]|nr:thioredoxin-like domain-containing protein [Candidatus Andersenbacteria bacterium]